MARKKLRDVLGISTEPDLRPEVKELIEQIAAPDPYIKDAAREELTALIAQLAHPDPDLKEALARAKSILAKLG